MVVTGPLLAHGPQAPGAPQFLKTLLVPCFRRLSTSALNSETENLASYVKVSLGFGKGGRILMNGVTVFLKEAPMTPMLPICEDVSRGPCMKKKMSSY